MLFKFHDDSGILISSNYYQY